MLVRSVEYDWRDQVLALKPGSARCILGGDSVSLRSRVQVATNEAGQRPALIMELEQIPSAAQLIDDVLATLAVTARDIWPVWYGGEDFGPGASALDVARSRLRLVALSHDLPEISPSWARRGVIRAMHGRLPLLRRFPRAIQLRQLGLAIGRGDLLLAIFVSGATGTDAQLLDLAQAINWLARNGGIAVAVGLPASLAEHPALDHVLFDPIWCEDDRADDNEASVSGAELTSATIWVSLGEGRTHALSQCEAKLAARLALDAELSPLFDAGQRIETVYRNQHTVDLLWREGRLVVEIDGPEHCQPQKYAADRHRDYELLVSGYTVLRLVNHQVLMDTERAVEQIRSVVRNERQKRFQMERSR